MYASATAELGPVKLSVGVGQKAVLKMDSEGGGVIVPGYGGVVASKNSIEASYGPLNVKVENKKDN